MLLGFGVLAIFANLGANAIVEQERKDAERRLLEIENLKLQLETLRYQINPHFFLNTLNNIQALVLIDPDKATESIGTFSKMMQMVLRDAKAPIALLSDEVCFLEYFIKLMRLRFTDDVQIDTRFPDETGDAVIQPLILTTFVENAFKHGISYEHPSFVRVQIELRDGTIVFRCENSLHSDSHPEGYGIGLVNARERLSLQYGDQFKLNTRAKEDSFVVELALPEHIDFPAV
ncbi:MAG: histidine kinase [Bacteroidales bacterium]|nr:histidine kinase [Bacteroidales bacterium]